MSYEAAFSYKFNQDKIINAAKRDAPDVPELNAVLGGANGGVCQLISLMWLALNVDDQANMGSTDMGKNYSRLDSAVLSSSGAAYWRQVCINFSNFSKVKYAGPLGYGDADKEKMLTEQFKLMTRKSDMHFDKVELFSDPKDLAEICSIMRSAWRLNNMGGSSIFGNSSGFMAYISLRFASDEGHGCAIRFVSDQQFLYFDPNMGVATVAMSELERFIQSSGDYYCVNHAERSPVKYHAFELQSGI